MCLIIDANKAADFCHRQRPYMGPLWDWVDRGGRIVSGGELERELFKVAKMRGFLSEWSRRGTLMKVSAKKVAQESQVVSAKCKSDDPHVIALARITGAAIVVTEDKDLIADLKNAGLVGRRRLIYKENSASPARIDRHRKMLAAVRCD